MASYFYKTPQDFQIHGFCERGFEDVEDVFRNNFEKKGEVGAAFTAMYKGRLVVDLWGGFKDKLRRQPWEKETMSIVFSTTKGISSLAFALLHARGLLDFEERVAHYWPEFAKNGKAKITVRQLLAHQAGLLTTDIPLTPQVIKNEHLLSKILADQKPFWEPGKYQGYHAWTIAMYQNEILKRIDPQKRSLSQFFHQEIAEKLGLEIFIGLPKGYNKKRIAELVPFDIYDVLFSPYAGMNLDIILQSIDPRSKLFSFRSLLNLPFSVNPQNFNKDEIRELPIGSGCGFSSARDLAKLYHEFTLGGKTLGVTKETITELENYPVYPTHSPKDVAIFVEVPFHLGFAKPSPFLNFGVNHRAYGSFGAGGSAVYADPELKLTTAYVMNKMGTHVAGDPREFALRSSVYDCVEKMIKKKKIEVDG